MTLWVCGDFSHFLPCVLSEHSGLRPMDVPTFFLPKKTSTTTNATFSALVKTLGSKGTAPVNRVACLQVLTTVAGALRRSPTPDPSTPSGRSHPLPASFENLCAEPGLLPALLRVLSPTQADPALCKHALRLLSTHIGCAFHPCLSYAQL